jgi:putative FmdB family regulatory protein
MPLYEFQCQNCGEVFDKLVRFSEADQLPTCPSCGEDQTQKKISAGALIGSSSSGGITSGEAPSSSPFT